MKKAIAITVEQHRAHQKRAFWLAYGDLLFGSNAKTQRILGLSILALALGNILTTPALPF